MVSGSSVKVKVISLKRHKYQGQRSWVGVKGHITKGQIRIPNKGKFQVASFYVVTLNQGTFDLFDL